MAVHTIHKIMINHESLNVVGAQHTAVRSRPQKL